MELSIFGFIKQVGEVQNLTTSAGKPFNKRELVIATNEQYPEVLVVEITGENATNFNGQIGQPITISYHFNARQASNGKYYNQIRCWRFSLGSANYPLQ